MEMMQQESAEETLKRACKTAPGSATWMKFLGVIMILQAVIVTISTMGLGIFFAWLPVWLGIILFRAANDAEMAATGMSNKLEDYLKKLNKYFLIQGILGLLVVIFLLVMMFVFGALFITGMLD